MYARCVDASGGQWPRTPVEFVRLARLVGGFEAVRYGVHGFTADLIPDRGRWLIRYNPDLPPDFQCVALLHEIAEGLQRTRNLEGTLFSDTLIPQPSASFGGLAELDTRDTATQMHRNAIALTQLYCADRGLRYHEVSTAKAPQTVAAPQGYANIAEELQSEPAEHEHLAEGRTFGKHAGGSGEGAG
jgi:hypothetical protein